MPSHEQQGHKLPTPKPRVGRDMTEGSILNHLIAFATPLLMGNALQALYNTVDSMWVGRFLGPEALGAVSVSFPIIFVLVSMIMGVTNATTIMVAQNAGAKRMDEVRRIIANSISLLLVSGLVVSVAGVLLHERILVLINVPPEILPEASRYLSVFLSGLIFMFGYNVFGAILRGLGDSRTPLMFLAYATTMNILLDPILIFGLGPIPGMGVAGAALATVISQAFSSVMAVRHMWKKTGLISRDIRDYKIDPELSLTTLKVGLPVGVQMTVVSFGQLVISSIINAFGPAVVAGFGAGARIDQFATMPSMSLGMSVSSIVGQNLGAGKQHRVHETVKRALVVSISIGATMTMVAMLFAPVILRIFTVSPEVLVQGSTYLRTVSLGYVPMAIMFTVNGVMRGAGDTFPTMVISVSTLWLIRVPLARYLSALPALGSNGIWWAVVASSAAGTMLSCAYYLSGRWKKRSVLRKHVAPEVADQPASGE